MPSGSLLEGVPECSSEKVSMPTRCRAMQRDILELSFTAALNRISTIHSFNSPSCEFSGPPTGVSPPTLAGEGRGWEAKRSGRKRREPSR